jgi:hypothetical protein
MGTKLDAGVGGEIAMDAMEAGDMLETETRADGSEWDVLVKVDRTRVDLNCRKPSTAAISAANAAWIAMSATETKHAARLDAIESLRNEAKAGTLTAAKRDRFLKLLGSEILYITRSEDSDTE